jgi:PKHD-type hydroxylase
MFLRIEELLTAAEVKLIKELAQDAKFINNTSESQMCREGEAAKQAAQITLAALERSERVKSVAFPQRVRIPLLARYGVGMKCSVHADSAYMPATPDLQLLRTDIYCSVFITGPNDYEGGELVAHLGSEVLRIKGNAGSAIFYPSTTMHQVTPVTSGERLVVVTFIESRIREEMHRDLLYSLLEAVPLEESKMDWRNRMQFECVIENLHRMWGN